MSEQLNIIQCKIRVFAKLFTFAKKLTYIIPKAKQKALKLYHGIQWKLTIDKKNNRYLNS